MGNTEGSRAVSNVFKIRKNIVIKPTNRQMSIIVGSILGDACVYKKGKICFEHSVAQKEYLLWKYSELENLAYPKVSKVIRYDQRYEKENISIRFFLRQYFRLLRSSFYPSGKKIIPKDIAKWLSPLAIAVWYMDDGHLDNGKYPIFATESFTLSDLEIVRSFLRDKYDISSIINKKKRLRIKSKSLTNFVSELDCHVIEYMRYKLP